MQRSAGLGDRGAWVWRSRLIAFSTYGDWFGMNDQKCCNTALSENFLSNWKFISVFSKTQARIFILDLEFANQLFAYLKLTLEAGVGVPI